MKRIEKLKKLKKNKRAKRLKGIAYHALTVKMVAVSLTAFFPNEKGNEDAFRDEGRAESPVSASLTCRL
jgi:hypothetical protein